MEEVPKMQVFVTCPLCRKEVELDKSLEITSGINICYDCAHMPREKTIEILLFRLLTEKEASQGGGRFKGQVERARKRSALLEKISKIDELITGTYLDLTKKLGKAWLEEAFVRVISEKDALCIVNSLELSLKEIAELKKEV